MSALGFGGIHSNEDAPLSICSVRFLLCAKRPGSLGYQPLIPDLVQSRYYSANSNIGIACSRCGIGVSLSVSSQVAGPKYAVWPVSSLERGSVLLTFKTLCLSRYQAYNEVVQSKGLKDLGDSVCRQEISRLVPKRVPRNASLRGGTC